MNAGQVCSAAERILVQRRAHDESLTAWLQPQKTCVWATRLIPKRRWDRSTTDHLRRKWTAIWPTASKRALSSYSGVSVLAIMAAIFFTSQLLSTTFPSIAC